jgi:hypothetical protein
MWQGKLNARFNSGDSHHNLGIHILNYMRETHSIQLYSAGAKMNKKIRVFSKMCG